MKPLLFSVQKNTKAAEIKNFLPVSVNFQITNIFPAMSVVEQRQIIPLLGKELFQRFVDYYNVNKNNESETDLFDKILELLQLAIAKIAYSEAYEQLSVKLDDSGATLSNEKDKRLYRYQEEALKRSLFTQGYDALDLALYYLESNIDIFPEYDYSDWRKTLSRSFIRSAKEFNDIYNINSSILVFMKLSYWSKNVEKLNLSHRLGTLTVKDFIEQRYSDDDKYTAVMNDLLSYVVYKTLSIGLNELKNDPTDRGVLFYSYHAYDDGSVQSQIPDDQLAHMMNNYDSYAEAYIGKVISYMNSHLDLYPEYKTHCGENNPKRNRLDRDNKRKKTFMV